MGSAGRQETSGDVDFAINTNPPHLVGQPDLPVFDLRALARRAAEVLPPGQVHTATLSGGQFQTLWEVVAPHTHGFVQCDFIAGDPVWLKFSHWSPGADRSPFKGVLISTMFGVLAKMRREWEMYEYDGRTVVGTFPYGLLPDENRVARIGWRYDLERGLRRSWQYRRRLGQGYSDITADEFETRFGHLCPRMARIGFVRDPETVLRILLGTGVQPHEVDTFEKLVGRIHAVMPERFAEAKERFIEAFMRSSGKDSHSVDELKAALSVA